jgi:hypothetical protein
MGDFNLTVILDAIRRTPGGLSRVELAQIVRRRPSPTFPAACWTST